MTSVLSGALEAYLSKERSTAMSYIDNALISNEHVVHRAHLHWLHFKNTISLVLVSAALGVAVHPGLAVVGLLVAAVAGVMEWIEWATFELALTNKRVIGKRGVIRRHTLELSLRKVERIEVDQGILGRLFGFGTVVVLGGSEAGLTFPAVTDPIGLRRAISVGIDEREAALEAARI